MTRCSGMSQNYPNLTRFAFLVITVVFVFNAGPLQDEAD